MTNLKAFLITLKRNEGKFERFLPEIKIILSIAKGSLRNGAVDDILNPPKVVIIEEPQQEESLDSEKVDQLENSETEPEKAKPEPQFTNPQILEAEPCANENELESEIVKSDALQEIQSEDEKVEVDTESETEPENITEKSDKIETEPEQIIVEDEKNETKNKEQEIGSERDEKSSENMENLPEQVVIEPETDDLEPEKSQDSIDDPESANSDVPEAAETVCSETEKIELKSETGYLEVKSSNEDEGNSSLSSADENLDIAEEVKEIVKRNFEPEEEDVKSDQVKIQLDLNSDNEKSDQEKSEPKKSDEDENSEKFTRTVIEANDADTDDQIDSAVLSMSENALTLEISENHETLKTEETTCVQEQENLSDVENVEPAIVEPVMVTVEPENDEIQITIESSKEKVRKIEDHISKNCQTCENIKHCAKVLLLALIFLNIIIDLASQPISTLNEI